MQYEHACKRQSAADLIVLSVLLVHLHDAVNVLNQQIQSTPNDHTHTYHTLQSSAHQIPNRTSMHIPASTSTHFSASLIFPLASSACPCCKYSWLSSKELIYDWAIYSNQPTNTHTHTHTHTHTRTQKSHRTSSAQCISR